MVVNWMREEQVGEGGDAKCYLVVDPMNARSCAMSEVDDRICASGETGRWSVLGDPKGPVHGLEWTKSSVGNRWYFFQARFDEGED